MAETKKLYGVFGITPAMLEAWKGQLRNDINVYIEDGRVEARLYLTGEEAKKARTDLKVFNRREPYELELRRIG